MLATPRRRAAIVAIALIVLIAGTAGYLLLRTTPTVSAAQGKATLTVFLGTVQVQRSGTSSFAAAHSGDTVAAGDQVQAGDAAKAILTYPDGSITRLDGTTLVKVRSIAAHGAGWDTNLQQDSGRTWNVVGRLVGGSSFKVSGPNNSTAEVRGTKFSVVVGTDSAGNKIVVYAVWEGTVIVSGQHGSQTVGAGQSSIVGKDSTPTPAFTTPDGSKFESWTVFNQTADIAAGVPVGFQTGKLTAVSTSASYPAASGDGKSDLQFTLGWPGSTMRPAVFTPENRLYRAVTGSKPPITIVAPQAMAGLWTFTVTDLESKADEIWWMIVSRVDPSTQAAVPFFLDATPCAHTVVAGQIDTWSVNAQDSAGAPTLAAPGLTKPGSFTDNGHGSGAITFSPDILAATSDVPVVVTASRGTAPPATLNCVEHILAAPRQSSISGVVSGAGAGVTLTLDPGAVQTTTDGTGSYNFGGLGPGHYTVTLTVPAGYIAKSATSAAADLVGTDSATASFVVAQVPTITGVSPTSGSVDGGTPVTISGIGLAGVSTVTFDGIAVQPNPGQDGSLHPLSPAHAAGTVTVTVAGDGGTASASFTYFIPAPVLTSLDAPTSGQTTGGTALTIRGTHLGGATGVTFGATAAASYSVTSDGVIVATSPAHVVGIVDVMVTTPQGTTAVVAADAFAYVPTITKVEPALGPAIGGTTVTITGAGLTGAASVKFGDLAAVSFTVIDDSHASAVTPQHVQGSFHVSISVPGGATPAQDTDRFTFQNWSRVRPDVVVGNVPHPVITITPGVTPPTLEGAAIAYNPENNRVFMFGGDNGYGPTGDGFEWNGVAWSLTWSGGGSSGPWARSYAAMTFDPLLHKYVLYGGNSDGVSNDVWAFDGSTWTELRQNNYYCGGGVARPGVPAPAASRAAQSPSSISQADCLRSLKGASLAFDSASGRLVLYGGSDNSGPINETWTSADGATWRLEPPGAGKAFPVGGRITNGADGKPVLVGMAGSNYTNYAVPGCTLGVDCYTYPRSHNDVLGLVANPVDGNVWFTEGDTDVIGRITPQGTVTRFHLIPTPSPIPTSPPGTTYEPQYMVMGPDGNLYFNEGDREGVGRINPAAADPSTTFRSWKLPPDGHGSTKEPLFIATTGTATNVTVWVAETEPWQNGVPTTSPWVCGIARINVSNVEAQWMEFRFDCGATGPDSGNPPTGLTIGSDGNTWFTTDDGRLGKILVGETDPTAIQFFNIGVHGRILNGPGGKLWWAGGEMVGWVNTTISATPSPSDYMSWNTPSGYDISRMTVGPDGNVWFTEGESGANNFIARVTPSGQITEFPLPRAYSEPTGIVAGPDGRLWVSLSDTNEIVALDEAVPAPATFIWDGASSTWVKQGNSVNPPARDLAGLALDPFSGRVVLFGGRTVDGTALGDTWTWDGTNWTQEAPAVPVAARYGVALATDSFKGVLLFGGREAIPLTRTGHVSYGPGPIHNDTWKWI